MLLRRSAYRFLLAGAGNTLVSYALYALLLCFLRYPWAYSLSYVFGIGFSYCLQRYFVFQKSGGLLGPLWVMAIYLAQYLLGLILVAFWVQGLGLPPLLAPAFAIAVSLPFTYLANRRVFRG